MRYIGALVYGGYGGCVYTTIEATQPVNWTIIVGGRGYDNDGISMHQGGFNGGGSSLSGGTGGGGATEILLTGYDDIPFLIAGGGGGGGAGAFKKHILF